MLGLSASTISHHLQVLANAGLATSTRRGRFVMYQQTASGSALPDSLRESSRPVFGAATAGTAVSSPPPPDDTP
jgi:DNA-binding transcriptional ArsR family regulator